MKRKNIIPLNRYTHLDEIITKQLREETNTKFYKKISTLRSDKNAFYRLSPIKKMKKNLSLPKLKIRLNNINNKEKELNNDNKAMLSYRNNKEKNPNKFMSFEEKMILNFYEKSILKTMQKRPKKINNIELNKYKSLFMKSKENYRKIDKIKLNRENTIYKKVIERFSNNYANFSNKIIMNKSFLNIKKKLGLKKT